MTPLHPTITTPYDRLALYVSRRLIGHRVHAFRTIRPPHDFEMVRRADGQFVAVLREGGE
jgi:hypothetical protein